jgi:hypothetical protein
MDNDLEEDPVAAASRLSEPDGQSVRNKLAW